MSKQCVAYFSATGQTAKAAESIAKRMNADLYEIKPEVRYTKKDLNWLNPLSRSSKEMHHKDLRPAMIKDDFDPTLYDTIYLGFPIWWYVAPTIINAFLESYDFKNKKIILFATSGGSGFGKTLSELQPSAPDTVFVESMVLKKRFSEEDIGLIAEMK